MKHPGQSRTASLIEAALNVCIDDLCALFFNVQGMLHGLLKQKGGAK